MHSKKPRTFEILLVEDNPADAELLQISFDGANTPDVVCKVRWLVNSLDVIPYLRDAQMRSHLPDLIIIDYRMPMNGGRALTELKGDPKYLHIPAIITGSVSPDDICDVYRRGANCCYRKPQNYDGYEALAGVITTHWLTQVYRPACRPE